MSKMTQREAVFQAVTNVLSENGITVSEGTSVFSHMTKEIRAAVAAILFEGFSNGTIELSKPYSSTSELKGYISGLISNWVKKDKRLNGNTKYTVKNPGSRRGSSDPQLKALKGVLSEVKTDEEREEIQGYIDARLAALEVSKKKPVSIDYSALPAELQARFSSN